MFLPLQKAVIQLSEILFEHEAIQILHRNCNSDNVNWNVLFNVANKALFLVSLSYGSPRYFESHDSLITSILYFILLLCRNQSAGKVMRPREKPQL